jgi:class 3 adenylate cyclase/tetratricopeptide (TPR) repeat protein
MSAEDQNSSTHNFRAQRSGERRQLTVMFCDLLGSTEVSSILDPEELSEVLQIYRAHVAREIAKYNGTIAQYLGDGILAYFGYPQANENDAECAIRAGLEIVRHLPALPHSKFRFNVRIGIATGLVVIGEAFETPLRGERLAIGETPNLAARLQALAPANGILIAETTRRLIGNLFDLTKPITVDVKGFADPVRAYEVKGISVIESRFEALRGEATPFIGREEEIGLLRRRWEQACQGEGRIVLLSGEAGIGKSRILDRMRKEFETVPGNCLRFFCSALHTQTALFPFISHLKKIAQLEDEDSDEAKLSALAKVYAGALENPAAAVDALAEFIGVSPQSLHHAAMSAEQRKEIAIQSILAYPVTLSRRAPVLIILEDAHWIDPTSIELLDRMVAQIQDQRILLVISARPEYQPVWTTHPAATLISLSRFGLRHCAALIAGVTGGKPLPPELTEQVLERSDGVPLFVEELTRMLLDSGWLAQEPDGFKLVRLPKLALPNTLQDSLTSRLDRLGPVKAFAQIGSVIGREFSRKLLQAVTSLADLEIDAALSSLIASGLIYKRGVGAEAVYLFRHALIQDAAYSTLLKSRRQQIHAGIADTILDSFPRIAAAQPEVIAYHLTEAEDFARAINYWLIAGKAQIRASAYREAIGHLKRGIGLLGQIASPSQRRQLELRLQTLIGALFAVNGPFASELAEYCEEGLALSTADGVSPMVFPFLYGQFTYNIATGKMRGAADIARRFIALAAEADNASGAVVGYRMLGLALLGLAELPEARRALESALEAYVPERDDTVAYLFGQNLKINCQSVLSMVLFCLGEEQAARRIGAECLRSAEALNHPHTLAISISYTGCWVNCLKGDIAAMHAQASRLLAISTEFGLQLYAPIGQFFLGLAFYEEGEAELGIDHMEKALAALERANFKLAVPAYLCALARAKAETGDLAEARTLCAKARGLMAESGEILFEPELICVEAEILLRADADEAGRARALMETAIARARDFASPTFEARCRRARDRLFPASGRRAS